MCQTCGNNICGGCQQPIIPTGINGVDGINAFNFTTASFTMPAVGSNVPVTVKSINPFKNSWFAIGQIVFIETAGYFQVVSTSGSNQVNLKNLGYTNANFTPAPDGTTIAPNAKVSPAGLQGQTGGSGGAGVNGVARVAYSLADIMSGTGGASKTFITQPVNAVDMPQTEGSSLVLTFNLRTQFLNIYSYFDSRNIGIKFGTVACISGTGLVVMDAPGGFVSQVKVEIIRASVATEAYARVSFYGVSSNNYAVCYNDSHYLTGLNFNQLNNFEIYGKQVENNAFKFSILTVDKIIAQ
jgi:hypothetical protein